MKKIVFKTFAFALFLTFVSCSSGSPASVTESFFEAMYSGDFEDAKQYASTDTKSMLSMLESFGAKDQIKDKMAEEDVDFEVVKTEIDGDKATCTVKLSNAKREKSEEMPIPLIKKDGKWLVDMSKESMDKEGMGAKPNKETGRPEPVLDSEETK